VHLNNKSELHQTPALHFLAVVSIFILAENTVYLSW